MILYIENLKESTKKLLELIKEFSKVAGDKINLKSAVFLYSSNEQSEKEIKKTVPFTIASKMLKHLRINLTKEVQDLYTENYKVLSKEVKEDLNKWKDILCSWIGRLIIVKISVLLKLIYKFSAVSIKISIARFAEMDKLILKYGITGDLK